MRMYMVLGATALMLAAAIMADTWQETVFWVSVIAIWEIIAFALQDRSKPARSSRNRM
jgi:hypothetical protein